MNSNVYLLVSIFKCVFTGHCIQKPVHWPMYSNAYSLANVFNSVLTANLFKIVFTGQCIQESMTFTDKSVIELTIAC